MASTIFVSYRRDDAAHVTGRMADALASRVGRENVFVDVDSVAPGEDFVRKIESTIQASDIFLAVIGASWLNAATPQGQRRIDLPGDFIRLEVKSALAAGIRIIPVLVDGADMPRADELPEDIRQLVRHNAVLINHTTFSRDMQALAEELRLPGPPPRGKRSGPFNPLYLAGAALMVLAILAIAVWSKGTAASAGLPGLSTSIALGEDPNRAVDRKLTRGWFKAERAADGKLSIRTQLPYRDRLMEERRIDGLSFLDGSPLYTPMPRLDVMITNSTDAPISITEIQFEIIRADPDLSALPVMRENRVDLHRIRMINDGWGGWGSPRLMISAWGLPENDYGKSQRLWRGVIESTEPCASPTNLKAVAPFSIVGATDDEDVVFDLSGHVPTDFGNVLFMCAIGELTYKDGDATKTVAFNTRVSNRLPDANVAPRALMRYDLYLDPDREGYTAVVPMQREVGPRATEALSLQIVTDKASNFTIRQAVRLSSGDTIPGETFELGIFLARNFRMGYILAEERYLALPQSEIAAFVDAQLISSVRYDPQGRAAALVELRDRVETEACEGMARRSYSILSQRKDIFAKEVRIAGPDGAWLCGFEAG